MIRVAPFVLLLATVAANAATADLPVYTDTALAQGWENWSWSTETNFAATDIFAGESGSSLSVTSEQWAALSFKLEGTFPDFAGMRFDISGANPDIQIYFESTVDGVSSPIMGIEQISKSIASDSFTSLLIDFSALPGVGGPLGQGNWDRINFQARANGATYHLDNIVLVSEIVITPEFLSAEPITSNLVAVTTKGEVDLTQIKVKIDGRSLPVASRTTYVPVDTPAKAITYLTLGTPLRPGNLTISSANSTFIHKLPVAQSGFVNQAARTPINPLIYGVNFPTNADYIKHLGVTVSRWGGNAVTAYNPFGGFTNAGNDWYFENRASESADDWIGWVHGAGSKGLLTIPALDWVSKDASSYSYPKTLYPEQKAFDPYNADAGNGQFLNGSWVGPPDQNRVYTPWNTTLAKQWLSGLKNKPEFVAIDNEIEIAPSTHQDMHPQPIDYDEELKRVVDFAIAAKEALPDVKVVAPSTCSWWFYWTSMVGWTDNDAHGGVDFLPWFLGEMKKKSQSAGKRLLDYLDIHYYYQPDTSANDAAAKALRLRMTRSLWDPTYVDESWVGTDPQNHQPKPDTVMLIPRFKQMINQLYPGTKLSISEFSSSKDDDITGGLVTVDMLGIFGKYGVDAATYWATPGELAPVGLAYWLFRGYGTFFGSNSVPVSLSKANPDILGFYAATESGKLSMVIVNKDPASTMAFNLSGVPTGKYFLRHFGGASGIAKFQTTTTLQATNYITVPPYTAIFLKQN